MHVKKKNSYLLIWVSDAILEVYHGFWTPIKLLKIFKFEFFFWVESLYPEDITNETQWLSKVPNASYIDSDQVTNQTPAYQTPKSVVDHLILTPLGKCCHYLYIFIM